MCRLHPAGHAHPLGWLPSIQSSESNRSPDRASEQVALSPPPPLLGTSVGGHGSNGDITEECGRLARILLQCCADHIHNACHVAASKHASHALQNQSNRHIIVAPTKPDHFCHHWWICRECTMDILLWILPLLLGPPAIAAFVWLERLPTTRLLPFARIATWPLAGRMCVFVCTLVMCGHSLLLIPAMLAGLGDVASRLWMWQVDAAILLVCLIAAVPAALGLGSPHRSVGAQLASWLCMTTAIACVTLGLTAELPWSCDVDAPSGPDCRPPAQHDYEKRQD